MEVSDNMPSEIVGEAEPVKVDSAGLLANALDDSTRKFLSVPQLIHENYQTFGTVTNVDQIREVPYSLRDVQDEHNQKRRISI